jgi:hypothetical protein
MRFAIESARFNRAKRALDKRPRPHYRADMLNGTWQLDIETLDDLITLQRALSNPLAIDVRLRDGRTERVITILDDHNVPTWRGTFA